MNTCSDCGPDDSWLPSEQDIRVHRLRLALQKLHEMSASAARDRLIEQLDEIIGRILLSATR